MKILSTLLILPLLAPGAIASEVGQVSVNSSTTAIGIAPGAGVTITFIPSQRVIQKVWLDDPTWVTLDSDGCLDKECKQLNATTLHLRRIKPLHIQGMPYTGASLLTVISVDAGGERQISTFRLIPHQSARYSVVEVIPSAGEVEVNASAVRQGLDVAVDKGFLRSGDLYQRVNRFLLLSQFQPVSVAASNAGISIQLIQRLSQLSNLHKFSKNSSLSSR